MKKVILLGVLGLVLLGVFTSYEAPVALVFGWISFLNRVLPQVSVDWPSLAAGGIALLLFTAGVQVAGRAWYRPKPPEGNSAGRRWKFSWSLAGVAGIFLLFVAGISLVGITHQVVWLLTSKEPFRVPTVKTYGAPNSNMNLHLIDMGMSGYRDSYPTYPPGGTFAPDGTMRHSWETEILPFMWYATGDIDMDSPWNSPRNQEYFRCIIPEFINPQLRGAPLEDEQGYGLSHYAANSRVFGANQSVSKEEIANRMSNTILVGEVNTNYQPWGYPVNWRDPARGINQSPYGFGGPPGARGVHFLMADGTVRFISDQISPEALRQLCTPPG